jgi:aspartyl aminopeptidase
MARKKTAKEIKRLQEELTISARLVWDKVDEEDKKAVFSFAREYMAFLDAAKTEREAVETIIEKVSGRGYVPVESAGKGTEVYRIHKGKCAGLAVIGQRPLSDGLRIVASHIDAPRLDLKQKPIYEDGDLAFLKTHYYGGIKKYQWVTRPLSLHGVIIKTDGSRVKVVIGEEEGDPVFTITDLLPHLARRTQYEKKLPEIIIGEKLNVLIGSLPFPEKEAKERFKLQVLVYLKENLGIVEEDFISAELEVVPAGRAREIGLDRSMVGAYGQDDRSSAYASLAAMLSIKDPTYTCIALFLDKEEIGSDGSTGAKSRFLESFVFDLARLTNLPIESDTVDACLMRSRAISADVNAAIDPDFPDVHEKRNDAKMGYGVCLTKYTGSRGKYGASDANAEYMGWIRKILNENKVVWQAAGLGKVDEGGGGTVAKFLAVYGMEIVDMGAPLLSMHSPFEIAHKGDLYMTYKALRAFLQSP